MAPSRTSAALRSALEGRAMQRSWGFYHGPHSCFHILLSLLWLLSGAWRTPTCIPPLLSGQGSRRVCSPPPPSSAAGIGQCSCRAHLSDPDPQLHMHRASFSAPCHLVYLFPRLGLLPCFPDLAFRSPANAVWRSRLFASDLDTPSLPYTHRCCLHP